MTIIGFAGVKQAGKDTAGNVLIARGFKKLAFAEPIKAMLKNLLMTRGATLADLARYTDGDLKETPTEYLMGQTPRHAMQTLGTEWGRGLIAKDLWLDTFKRRAANVLRVADRRAGLQVPPGERRTIGVVATDIRFQNEVDTIRELGGKVYRVVRPALHIGGDTHSSEIEIAALNVDGELLNDFQSALEFQDFVAAKVLDTPA